MSGTRAGRVASWIIGLLPARVRDTFFQSPERALVNLACILIGVQALLRPPDGNTTYPRGSSPLVDWPVWLHYEWGIAMIIGGAVALIAQWTENRPAVRFSAATIGLETWLYAGQVLLDVGARGAITATIFFALGTAALARVLLSMAVTERIIALHNYTRLAKEQQDGE